MPNSRIQEYQAIAPEPAETGKTGDQQANTGTALVPDSSLDERGTIGSSPMVEAVTQLYASQAARLGGQVAAILIPAIAATLSHDADSLRREAQQLRRELRDSEGSVSSLKVKNARLEERLMSQKRGKRFRDAMLLFAPMLFSLGVAIALRSEKGEGVAVGVILAVIALAIAVTAWFSSPDAINLPEGKE